MAEIRFSKSYTKKVIKFFKQHKDIYPQYKKTIEILKYKSKPPIIAIT